MTILAPVPASQFCLPRRLSVADPEARLDHPYGAGAPENLTLAVRIGDTRGIGRNAKGLVAALDDFSAAVE